MPLQQEIQELKSQLSALNKEKELYFQEKEELKAKLKLKMQSLKQGHASSKLSQKEINELRQQRDLLNKEVHELIQESKNLNEKKQEMLSKSGMHDPERILRQIKALETKVETEALSINKEKEVMRQIRDLKKLHTINKETADLLKAMSELSKKIDDKRKKADEYHNKLKSLSKGTNYSQLRETSKEFLGLRKQQEQSFQKFIEAKTKVSEINSQLKNKFSLLSAEKKIIAVNKHQQEFRKQQRVSERQQREQEIIKEKQQQAEEKLKTKKHLTNEDLVVFQGG